MNAVFDVLPNSQLYTNGVAYAIPRLPEPFRLRGRGLIENWQPLRMELRNGGPADFLESDLGCRPSSLRLKNILDTHASSADVRQWLPVDVIAGTSCVPYFIMNSPAPPDGLDPEKTFFSHPGHVVKPVFRREAIAGHNVFVYPGAGSLTLFVKQKVRRAMKAAGCTGCQYIRVPVV